MKLKSIQWWKRKKERKQGWPQLRNPHLIPVVALIFALIYCIMTGMLYLLLVFLGFVILIVTIVLYYAARKKRPPEFNPNEKKKEEGVVTVKTPRRWRRWIVWALILTIIIFAALKFFPDIENNFDKPRQESATERLCIPAQEERWTKVPIPETWPGWRLHIDEIPGTWVSFLLPEGIEYGPYGPYDKIKLPAGIRNFSIKGNRTFCIFPK